MAPVIRRSLIVLTLGGLCSVVGVNAVGAAAKVNTVEAATKASPRAVPLVTAVGTMSGFRLTAERISQGTVTAVWSRSKLKVLYLGGSGSRVSISTAGSTSKHTQVLAGASNPSAVGTGNGGLYDLAHMSNQHTMLADIMKAGISARSAQQIAATDRTLIPRNAGDIEASWCIDIVYGDAGHLQGAACDTRTVLQEQTGNNYIADDMQATDKCDVGNCVILHYNVHMDYNFASENQAVHLEPLDSHTGNCSAGPTVSFTWFGIGFSYTETMCGGTMTPEGLSQAINIGGYWKAGSATQGPIGIEEVIQDHATGHLNPDSVLYLFQEWFDSIHGHGEDGGHCPDPTSC